MGEIIRARSGTLDSLYIELSILHAVELCALRMRMKLFLLRLSSTRATLWQKYSHFLSFTLLVLTLLTQ